MRQENAFTQRAVYLAYQTACQRCALREQCLAKGAKGDRARRVSAVRRLLPPRAPLSGIGFYGAVKQQPALVLVPDASVPVCAPADGVQKVAVVSWEP